MRNHTRLAAILLATGGMMCAHAPAQQITSSPVESRIRAQELTMRDASGNADGISWLKLAILNQDAARYARAESAYRKAIALLKAKDSRTLASALDHLGTLYVERGNFAKAEPLERKALEIREESQDIENIGVSYTHLATLSYGRHDLAAAEDDAAMAVSILFPENSDHPSAIHATPEEQMSALINLSLIQCARSACDRAIHNLNRALNLAHAHYAINSVPVGLIDFLLGYAHWKSGDNHNAEELMLAGITEMGEQLGWGHPTYVAALKQHRTFLLQQGETAQANELGIQIAGLEKSSTSAVQKSNGALLAFSQLR